MRRRMVDEEQSRDGCDGNEEKSDSQATEISHKEE